jgi:CRP-like cAMP-binding protein
VIAREARRHEVARGEFFFHADDPATVVHVLTQGRAKLMQITPEGHQVTLLMVPPGALLGGLAALEDTVYGVWALAMDDCQALGWPGKTMACLLEAYPRLAVNILRLINHRMQDVHARFTELCTERVEQRVARTLVRLAGQYDQTLDGAVLVTLPISHQDLAEMVGTTQYSVSRILGRWQEQGLIEAHRRQVVISRPHGLVAIAEDLPPNLTSADSR